MSQSEPQSQPEYFYCTFWYPTIFHQELMPLTKLEQGKIQGRSCDISDESQDKRYLLNITLDYQGNLIVTSSYNKDKNSEPIVFAVTLCKTEHRRSGFVQYRVDASKIYPECLEIFKNIILVKDVYHLAKEFYHEHEADPEKDAALRAVITQTEGGIDGDDNLFLIKFLTDFTPVFESYAREISSLNSSVIEVERNLMKDKRPEIQEEQYQQAKKKAEDAILWMVYKINRLCENACIEYTYCKTLLSSKYNKSFIHNLKIAESDPLRDQKNEWRRNALNIRNSMRYIENIKYKNQNRLGRQSRDLVQEIDAVVAETKDNTEAIQTITEEVRIVIKEVKTNTENIKLALAKGKQAEKINLTFARFSIFISIIFGSFALLDDKLDDKVFACLTIRQVGWISLFAGICVFIFRLRYQYTDKYLSKFLTSEEVKAG